MRHLPLIAALAITPATAHAKCDLTVEGIRENLTPGTTLIEASPKAFYFLEGIWAMSPATPKGIPENAATVFVLRKAGSEKGEILFFTKDGCFVPPLMGAPRELTDLIDQVDKGPGEPL